MPARSHTCPGARGCRKKWNYCEWVRLIVMSSFWFAQTAAGLKCPDGYLYYEEMCIANVDESLSYLQAEDKCKDLGGDLAIFNSSAMQREVLRWLRIYDSEAYSRRYWMGVRFEYVNKTQWMWVLVNGRVLKPQDYQVWADTKMHDITYPPCGVFRGGYWRHEPCDAKLRSLCQIKAKYCDITNITVPHGFITDCRDDTTYLPAESVGIGCDEGCTLFGTPYITCFPEGSWSKLPQCKPGCPTPEAVGHSNLAYSLKPSLENFGGWFNVGHVIIVLCDEGFFYFDAKGFARTKFVLQCEHSGTWTRSTPACIPLSQMDYSYSVHEVTRVEIGAGETYVLTCAESQGNGHFESRVWLKDQVEVTSLPDSKTLFQVSQNSSSLTIPSFSGEDGSGIYICITDLGVQGLRVNSYDVMEKDTQVCAHREDLLLKPKDTSVRAGTRLLLRCYAKNAINTWFKNGVRLEFRRGLRTLPDGSLLVDRVQQDDKGKYTCLAAIKGTRCVYNATARVRITGDSRSLCGFSSELPNNDGPVSASVFPWLASLWLNDDRRPFCYGSLLDDRWVLTSTTCVYGTHRFRLPPPAVRVGVDSTSDAPNAPLVTVDRIFTHPNYAWSNTRNDIALLRLNKRIILSEMVRPICLPPVPPPVHVRLQRSPQPLCDGDDQKDSTPAYGLSSSVPGVVCGWGSVENRVKRNRHLKFERLHVVSRQTCQESVSFRLPASLFCAHSGEPSNVTESVPLHAFGCAGDSGSPFQVRRRGRWYLHGVFTRGERYISEGKFDFFTRVENYVPWIETYLRNDDDDDDLDAANAFGSITKAYNDTAESNDIRLMTADDFDLTKNLKRVDRFPLWGSNIPSVLANAKEAIDTQSSSNVKASRSLANMSVSQKDYPSRKYFILAQSDIQPLIDENVHTAWSRVTYRPSKRLETKKTTTTTPVTTTTPYYSWVRTESNEIKTVSPKQQQAAHDKLTSKKAMSTTTARTTSTTSARTTSTTTPRATSTTKSVAGSSNSPLNSFSSNVSSIQSRKFPPTIDAQNNDTPAASSNSLITINPSPTTAYNFATNYDKSTPAVAVVVKGITMPQKEFTTLSPELNLVTTTTYRPFVHFSRRRFKPMSKFKPKSRQKSTPAYPTSFRGYKTPHRSHVRHNPPVHINATFKHESRRDWLNRRKYLSLQPNYKRNTPSYSAFHKQNGTAVLPPPSVTDYINEVKVTTSPTTTVSPSMRSKRQVGTDIEQSPSPSITGSVSEVGLTDATTASIETDGSSEEPMVMSKRMTGQVDNPHAIDGCPDGSYLNSGTDQQPSEITDADTTTKTSANVESPIRNSRKPAANKRHTPLGEYDVQPRLDTTTSSTMLPITKDQPETPSTVTTHVNGKLAGVTPSLTGTFEDTTMQVDYGPLTTVTPRTNSTLSSKSVNTSFPRLPYGKPISRTHVLKHPPQSSRINPGLGRRTKIERHNETLDILSVSVSASFTADKKFRDRYPNVRGSSNASRHVAPSANESGKGHSQQRLNESETASKLPTSLNNATTSAATSAARNENIKELHRRNENETVSETKASASPVPDSKTLLLTGSAVTSETDFEATHASQNHGIKAREVLNENDEGMLGLTADTTVTTEVTGATTESRAVTDQITETPSPISTWRPTIPPCFARRRHRLTRKPNKGNSVATKSRK